jgi:hypothetical protein
MEHELLERLATLRDDEQPVRGAAGDEGLLDRAATRDELLVLADEIRRRQRRARVVGPDRGTARSAIGRTAERWATGTRRTT